MLVVILRTIFTVNETSYHRICGKARGYQRNIIDAFRGPPDSSNNKNINDYVDGLSITLGSPRKHVWTYAAEFSETGDAAFTHNCPCAAIHGYYCESEFAGAVFTDPVFYTSNPLWDGSGCIISDTNSFFEYGFAMV